MRVCSRRSQPTVSDMTRLKRIGRYLLHRPRARYRYRWQAVDPPVQSDSDSDWGDKRTRMSVSGGALFLGEHIIETWAKVQTSVATSSADLSWWRGIGTKVDPRSLLERQVGHMTLSSRLWVWCGSFVVSMSLLSLFGEVSATLHTGRGITRQSDCQTRVASRLGPQRVSLK